MFNEKIDGLAILSASGPCSQLDACNSLNEMGIIEDLQVAEDDVPIEADGYEGKPIFHYSGTADAFFSPTSPYIDETLDFHTQMGADLWIN